MIDDELHKSLFCLSVTHSTTRNFVLCLLELARIGYKYGLEAPCLIAMEKEIDRLEQNSCYGDTSYSGNEVFYDTSISSIGNITLPTGTSANGTKNNVSLINISTNGTTTNDVSSNGTTTNGTITNGVSLINISTNDTKTNEVPSIGTTTNGTTNDMSLISISTSTNGTTTNDVPSIIGTSTKGTVTCDKLSIRTSTNGTMTNGMLSVSTSTNGLASHNKSSIGVSTTTLADTMATASDDETSTDISMNKDKTDSGKSAGVAMTPDISTLDASTDDSMTSTDGSMTVNRPAEKAYSGGPVSVSVDQPVLNGLYRPVPNSPPSVRMSTTVTPAKEVTVGTETPESKSAKGVSKITSSLDGKWKYSPSNGFFKNGASKSLGDMKNCGMSAFSPLQSDGTPKKRKSDRLASRNYERILTSTPTRQGMSSTRIPIRIGSPILGTSAHGTSSGRSTPTRLTRGTSSTSISSVGSSANGPSTPGTPRKRRPSSAGSVCSDSGASLGNTSRRQSLSMRSDKLDELDKEVWNYFTCRVVLYTYSRY